MKLTDRWISILYLKVVRFDSSEANIIQGGIPRIETTIDPLNKTNGPVFLMPGTGQSVS